MTQKDKIILALQNKSVMTQNELSVALYGDSKHMPNLYASLMDLVKNGIIVRKGSRPTYYLLTGTEIKFDVQEEKQSHKTITPLTNDTLIHAALAVEKDTTYSQEEQLLREALIKYPSNDDRLIVAMKIGLIDITNSTHISQHKSRVNVVELLNIIMEIKDLDQRISAGDEALVYEISQKTKQLKNGNGANFFSFASKFCCYHNLFVYGKDDYSIYDSKLRDHLQDYDALLKPTKIINWVNSFDYHQYNAAIGNILDKENITVEFRRRKFDNLVWYSNR